jgi:hypothetical protein
MRLEYSYTLSEWVECRRAHLGRRRFVFLRLLEKSLPPITCLLAVGLVLTILTPGLPGSSLSTASALISLALLVSLAAAHIYLSSLNELGRKALERDWAGRISSLRYSLEISETEIRFNSVGRGRELSWSSIGSYFETDSLLVLCDKGDTWLCIPKRAFAGEEQMKKFMAWVCYLVPQAH